MWINGHKSQTFLFFKTKVMGNYVSDGERLTQLSLNKKIKELKQKEKELQELQDTIEILNRKLKENNETIDLLCRQISSLVCNQHIRHA